MRLGVLTNGNSGITIDRMRTIYDRAGNTGSMGDGLHKETA